MRENKNPSQYTVEQKRAELWRRGVLAQWLCHETQMAIYDAYHKTPSKKFVLNTSRRLGKSFLLCVIALEKAIGMPNAQIKFAAPTQKAVKKIITPLMRQLLETCPPALQPKLKTVDGVYEFPNGSEIHMAGTEQGQADSLRGTSCDLAIVDEAGFATDLEYLVESILMPQMLTRPNARLLLASTPPETPDHPFFAYVQKAQRENAYAKYTIYDNPLLGPEKIEEFKEEAGGENSSTWRREYLAEFVTDTDKALFPEATDELLKDIVVEVQRPEFYLPFAAMDLGFMDHTATLFGYYYFSEGKIVIEDEYIINKTTTDHIVAACRQIEKNLWGDNTPKRVVDGNPMAIADLNNPNIHNYRCFAPEKADLAANVNRVRIDLAGKNILISPKCTNLITQLKHATWNGDRTKFSRSSSGGHWDAIAALIYFCKHVDRRTNPIPAGFGWDFNTSWGVPRKHKNTNHDALRRLFPAIATRRVK